MKYPSIHDILCDLENGFECAQEEGFFDEYDEFELTDENFDENSLVLRINGENYKLELSKL